MFKIEEELLGTVMTVVQIISFALACHLAREWLKPTICRPSWALVIRLVAQPGRAAELRAAR